MKKVVLLLLVVSMLICVFAACGKEAATEQVSVSEAFVAPETPEPTEEPEEETEDEEAPADATPSPSPSPSPKAGEQSTDSGNSGSTSTNSNSGSQSTTTQSESTPAEETESESESESESVDPLTAAQGCIGASVSTLKSAIGEPNSSNYVASCLQPDTEDGYLSYDGFTVATVRYADGTEVVSDVY